MYLVLVAGSIIYAATDWNRVLGFLYKYDGAEFVEISSTFGGGKLNAITI